MKRLLALGLVSVCVVRLLGDDGPRIRHDIPCDCERLINDINVSRAMRISDRLFQHIRDADWLDVSAYYFDKFHSQMTHAVHVFSSNADRQLAGWVTDVEEEEEGKKKQVITPLSDAQDMSDYFNKLFRDQTYLYSSEASYMILRLGMESNKEEGAKFLNELKFAISLPQTENTLQLFVGDPREENKELVDEQGNVDTTTSVGARYFVPEFIRHLKTSATAGMRGIANPFAQIRFEYPAEFDDWLIRPVQYFEYSVEREFYEETNLYFDRKLARSEMFRIRLQRKTETQRIGMNYSATVIYYNTFAYGTGLRTYAGFSGNTELDEGRYENSRYAIRPSAGIYLYNIGMGWKQSFFRKWLFYEIEPRVDFDMLYDWKPNYVVRYWIEIFFGDM